MEGGLDLDRKWIITGNEIIMWQAHLIIEACVCKKCQAVVVQETNVLLYVWEADSVQSQLDGTSRSS